MLQVIPNHYKTQKNNRKSSYYPHALKYAPDCYMTQGMCEKAVDTSPFMLYYTPNCYKTQEMGEKTVSKEHFTLKYCLNRCETQEMCDSAVDAYVPLSKFVPDCFVTKKMLKDLDNAVF